jgi:hypothetical protein
MKRVAFLLGAGLACAGCAQGVCTDCPTTTLTANGQTTLAAHVGDQVAYAWSSTNADTATSTLAMTPAADLCGNKDGPWVVSTTAGAIAAAGLLPCQAGTTYTLALTVTQTTTSDTATATVTIAVQ